MFPRFARDDAQSGVPEVECLDGEAEDAVIVCESVAGKPAEQEQREAQAETVDEDNQAKSSDNFPFMCKESRRCKRKYKTNEELLKHVKSWHQAKKNRMSTVW